MMKKARHTIMLLAAPILISSAFPLSAQVVDISACRAIEDRLQRFDCYENLQAPTAAEPQAEINRTAPPAPLRSVERTPAPAAAPQAPATAVVPPASQSVETFGTRPAPAASSARIAEDDNGKAELRDHISALEQRGPNLWLITLESGQQWAQMLSKRYAIRAGDEVRIYPTRFGQAYRLTAPRLSGFIQVERVD